MRKQIRIREERKTMRVPVNELAILLLNVIRCRDKFGWNNGCESYEEFYRESNKRRAQVSFEVINEMLYACNMLEESGKFVDPLNRSFNTFVKRVVGANKQFNPTYNRVLDKKKKRKKRRKK